ncbi:hypothetical protein E2562_002046 [Oryza meyeriana var. granulata]|uniref:Uncharacterized protein n=1 Tax=Oryza meyeriana var. granulata TaxID=110450 RepID=A0A6G1EEE9_9ORYZ|nr:hypothetical protein E2562_002046 [Oryza meyeriana var. granulata]
MSRRTFEMRLAAIWRASICRVVGLLVTKSSFVGVTIANSFNSQVDSWYCMLSQARKMYTIGGSSEK